MDSVDWAFERLKLHFSSAWLVEAADQKLVPEADCLLPAW
jgi:hypothetical protein